MSHHAIDHLKHLFVGTVHKPLVSSQRSTFDLLAQSPIVLGISPLLRVECEIQVGETATPIGKVRLTVVFHGHLAAKLDDLV